MPGKAEAPSLPPLRIDRLRLVIGTVVYRDSSGVYEFPVNLDETFTGITDASQLIGLVVSRALGKTTIPALAGVDMSAFQGYASDMAAQMAGTSGAKVASVLKSVSVDGAATAGSGSQASRDTAAQINQLLRSFGNQEQK